MFDLKNKSRWYNFSFLSNPLFIQYFQNFIFALHPMAWQSPRWTSYILLIGRVLLCAMLCFLVARCTQLLFVHSYFPENSFQELLPSLFNCLYLDSATAAYFTIAWILFFFIDAIWQKSNRFFSTTIFSPIIGILYAAIVTGETLLYKEWKTKLSIQALLHFKNPTEVFHTAGSSQALLFFGILSVLFVVFVLIYKRIVAPYRSISISFLQKLIISIPLFGILFLVMRGGLQPVPMQVSDACKSSNIVCNDIAVNPLFSLGANIKSYLDFETKNPYQTMSDADAENICKQISGTTWQQKYPSLFSTKQPNIVFIYLESWSADACGYRGASFTPSFDALCKEGLLYSNCYAAGIASDQGIPAVLSSIPAAARTSIINESTKSASLVCFNNYLSTQQYTSAFYFGGQLSYGNIKNYLIQKKFDLIKEQKDLQTTKDKIGYLGIEDKSMVKHFLQEIQQLPSPFFANWFTISSHSPYDIPVAMQQLTSTENEYINSVKYSDAAIGEFFAEAKKTSWYANTLFVIVADHSHHSHLNNDVRTKDRMRVPLLLVGGGLQKDFQNKQIKQAVSQCDITPSLLHQLQIPFAEKDFMFSKHLLDTSSHYACYGAYTGGGIFTDSFGMYIEDAQPNIVSFGTGKSSLQDTLLTKAALQMIYKKFRGQ
jgi:phosphoglycerol transferase MdoB-like AlkP superfamily enzyme